MNSRKLMLGALSASLLASAMFASCEEDSIYKVNAPDDLQNRIDAVAAANAAVSSGDTTKLTISMLTVGAKDNSDGWNTAQSDIFNVPAGKMLHLEFINYSAGVSNWNNWNLAYGTTADVAALDDANAYYFLIRSDAYGWGGTSYTAALLTNDYFDEGKAASWEEWLPRMNGAYVTMDIDHSSFGPTYVTVQNLGNDGIVYTEKYTCEGSDSNTAYAWLVCDNSHFEMKTAYLIPSQVAEIKDEMPVSISVKNTPSSIEIGQTDFWGKGVATVTFADGSSIEADTADITFAVIPDLTSKGSKTVAVAYSKSKQGNYCQAVTTTFNFDVLAPVKSIAASAKAYFIGGAKFITLSPEAIQVIASYSDATTALLPVEQFEVAFAKDKVVYEAKAGTIENAFTVTYTTTDGKKITSNGNLEIIASSLAPQTTQVGATDFSTGWWVPEGTTTADWKVAPGTSQTVSMKVGSDNAGNWHSPCTIIRKASMAEYTVVRMDHFGWGDSYAGIASASNWNWDTFMGNINGSQVAITVSNYGDGTASVRYYVVYANGEEHFQYYDKIDVDANDVQFGIVTEESYLIFD